MTPSTVADLLGDPGAGIDAERLVSAVTARRADVSDRTVRLLRGQIRDAVTDLLDIELGTIVLDMWSTYASLRTAARRSLEPPGTDQPVPLHSHRITSTHRPRIELYVDDSLVGVLEVTLEIYAEVHTIDVIVRRGRLVAVGAGDVDIGASLSVGDGTPVDRHVTCPTGALLSLGSGFDLLGGSPPPTDPTGRVAAGSAAGPGRSSRRGVRSTVVAGLVVVVLAAAGVLVVAVPASAWPWAAAGVSGVVEPNSAWNMRATPSGQAAILGVVQPGQRVAVDCLTRGWARLTEPRDGAYVDGRGLRLSAAPPRCP